MEEARLVKIKEVLKELPVPHYRTLEFLMRHLLRMATHSRQTNMHARNLAIVWAPNLLRSRDIEATGFNGTAAFMEVRVQSIVVEFILTHVEQLFGDAPLLGGESPRRSRLLAGGGPGEVQPPPYHVPAALSQGDGPPPIRPYHTIIELSDHRRKGSLKAKKWRSIFNLGRSSHEAKRKLVKAEEKDDKCGKMSLRPAKSMDSLSSVPFTGDGTDTPRLSQKQPAQRRESFDTCPSPPQSCPELDESLEDKLPGLQEPRGPESEGESSSTKSEPTTPKAGRAALVAPGRSPKAARGRADKCAGVHISGPFSVTVPFHITSNLSRLTRGMPCPALAAVPAGRETPDSPPAAGRRSNADPAGEGKADAEQSRLSLELRDSFAFLDSAETWLESSGDGEGAAWAAPPSPGDGERCLAVEDGMDSGFMNPGEPPAEQPDSYLSIEECMDEEMFFMAPSGSDTEERAGDTDSDDMFLSAHDELSPLAAPLEPLGPAPGEGTAPETSAGPQDRAAAEEEEGELPRDPGEVQAEEEAPGTGQPPGEGADGGGSPCRTDSSTDTVRGAAGSGGLEGAGPGPQVEEDGCGSGPPSPEEPGEGEAPSAPHPEEDPPTPEAAPPSPGSTEGTGDPPGSPPGSSPSLSASAPDLRSVVPAEPRQPEPEPVLRRDGRAAVRLATGTVRVLHARSVPVVPPKPQFARIPPALQPWEPPAAGAGSPGAGSPGAGSPGAGSPGAGSPGARRAGWRDGGSASFDAAVAVAAQQQPPQAPVRRIQTYGGGSGDPAPAAPKALPFHRAPLRPRLLRPLSCAAAPEAEGLGRSRRSPTQPALQLEAPAPGSAGEGGER
ncbi:rho GTPase-activating protein 30 isoform X3 [Colius striatus]|nr:rho GTPase-activating protein 30 isoform X3 [Colius striatus]